MPGGFDPHQIIAERNRYVDTRIQQRMAELEAAPATMRDGGFESIADNVEDTGLSRLIKVESQGAGGAVRIEGHCCREIDSRNKPSLEPRRV